MFDAPETPRNNTKRMFEIPEPTVDQIFQRAIDQAGYHDKESIPVEEVRRLFIGFFNYQFQRNQQLQRYIDDYRNCTLKPIQFVSGGKR